MVSYFLQSADSMIVLCSNFQVLLASGANSYAKEEHSLNPREFICKCISYHFDESLNQCAPGRCLSVYDRLVVESMIDQVSILSKILSVCCCNHVLCSLL